MDYQLLLGSLAMNVDDVWVMLRATYWSAGIRREVIARAIENSVCVGVLHAPSGRQVAFARAVTDRATFAWLCDVIVDPEHRGCGLSKQMCAALFADPELQTLRRWALATRDANGLYQRYGFAAVPPGGWMEYKLPLTNWQQAAD